jgi:hypothetical protein
VPGVEPGGASGGWPLLDQQNQERAGRGGGRANNQRQPPVEPAERQKQVRAGGAECDRADQQPDHQPHVADRPAGGQPHADRIDSGHAEPGRQAQSDDRPGIRRQGKDREVGDRCQQGAGTEQVAAVDPIGQAKEGADKRAGDESQLDAAGEPGRQRRRDRHFGPHRRNDGGGREPQRHRRHLGDHDQGQREQARRWHGGRRDRGHGSPGTP